MKKRRIRNMTAADIARIPVTRVKREANYDRTLADYNRRIAGEEAQKTAAEQARFAEATAETGRILAQIRDAQKELTKQVWGLPLEQLNNPQVRQQENAFDEFVGLSDGRFANQTVETAFGDFLDQSLPLVGHVLNEDGMKRLCWFGVTLHNRSKDLSTPEAWAKCFDRLLDCGAFAYGEVVLHEGARRVVAQPRVEQPVEQPRRVTYADLDNVDDSTRAGKREANRISEKLYEQQAGPILHKFCDHLESNFGFRPTMEDISGPIQDWFNRNNKSWIDPRSYDEVRRYMVSSGRWPQSVLTNLEAFTLSLEDVDLAHLTHEQRRTIALREKLAKEADIKRFGHY